MNSMIAASQLASRPADQSFGSLDAFLAHVRDTKQTSRERTLAVRDLRAHPHADGSVVLASPEGRLARPTHWSFGQLARLIGAPAEYLRTLPADIAAAAINHGIQTQTARSQDVIVLAQAPRPTGPLASLAALARETPAPTNPPVATLRAITGDRYGRVWDADLYSEIIDGTRSAGYDLAPVWPHLDKHGTGKGGAYASDRDSFLLLTAGGSMVTDPSATRSVLDRSGSDGRAMYRAILLRNSEVGAASVRIWVILYRIICGNHILWGASTESEWKRRHVGQNAERDSIREILRIARTVGQQSAAEDERIIRRLIDLEIAQTREAVIDELRGIGYTESAANAAYDAAERQEISTASPRSYWGIVQGTTWTSQQASNGYQDARLTLDGLAAQLLTRGRKLVAA